MRRRRQSIMHFPTTSYLLLLLLFSTYHSASGVDIPNLISEQVGPSLKQGEHLSDQKTETDSSLNTPSHVTNGTSSESNAQDGNSSSAADNQSTNTDTNEELKPKSPGLVALDTARNASIQQTEGQPKSPSQAIVKCGEGACEELSTALLDAVEGSTCRSLFLTGKCPAVCANAIGAITKNETWPECATACAEDIVMDAAERWVGLCDARKETLIEQGKEAVKSIHQGITQSLHARVVFQFLFGVLILIMGVVYGYRRGVISAAMAYRIQKRRLGGRKNSDNQLPI